jgi:RNA polymerase sigma-70 factor (ECF subfamily)
MAAAAGVPWDDAEVIRLCQIGDARAFHALVTRHRPPLLALIRSIVRDRDDADDLAQEVFIKAYRSISRFELRSKISTWLYRIAINRCTDWMRSRQRHREACPRYAAVPGVENVPSGNQDIADEALGRRELGTALEEALRALPPSCRTTIVLREREGLTYEEIGQALGCSVGTVKSRLFRARNGMQRALAGFREEWQD